jgi:cephalosporin-C deacetylase
LIVLGVGSLDQRVKAVVAEQPFLCDFLHNPAMTGSKEVKDPVFLRTWSYFEPMNLVPKMTAPTLLLSGGQDKTCPPETIRAVFDRLNCIKALFEEPGLPHTASIDFYSLGWEWLDRYLN